MRRIPSLILILTLFVAAIYYATLEYDFYNKNKLLEIEYSHLTPAARKQVDCLTENIYHEARGEPEKGQLAVALVTMNRVYDERFPDTICGVVKERTHNQGRTVCQFSWYCMPVTLNRKSYAYYEAQAHALHVYANYGKLKDFTQGALFYHADYVSRSKLGQMRIQPTITIGRHIFYNEGELYATKTQSTTEGRQVKTLFLLADGRN
jgi:N-acetylmuramoyl-L-alanine amidase